MADQTLDVEAFLKEGLAESVSNLQDVRARLVAEQAQVHARLDEIKDGLRRIDKVMVGASPDLAAKKKRSRDRTGQQSKGPAEWRVEEVVALLKKEGAMRTRNVAQRLGWSQGTASQVLTHARKRELIRISGFVPGVKGKAPIFAVMEDNDGDS